MQVVFQLMHLQESSNIRSRIRIGLYKTAIKAQDAIAQLKNLPGFRDSNGTFLIYECTVNYDYSPDGLDVQETISKLPGSVSSAVDADKLFFVYNEPTMPAQHSGDTAYWLGYYTTENLAQLSIERMKQLEIYPKENREFNYCAIVLDQTNWTSGYTTIEEVMKQYQ